MIQMPPLKDRPGDNMYGLEGRKQYWWGRIITLKKVYFFHNFTLILLVISIITFAIE